MEKKVRVAFKEPKDGAVKVAVEDAVVVPPTTVSQSQPKPGYFPLDFPSKYRVYPDVDPSKVGIRTLKGKDEKLIAELTYDNFEKKFIEVLKNTLIGIDPRQLTIGDRMYIMLWQAINSYNKMAVIDTTCEHCFQKMEMEIDLSTLQVIDLPIDFVEPYKIKLSTGDIVNLKIFRVSDEEKMYDVEKAGYQTWLYRYALTIIDPKKGDWDKVAMLEEMDTRDLALIRAFHEKYTHGPKLETTLECPKCGGVGLVPVPFRLEMFFPYGKSLRRYFGDTI